MSDDLDISYYERNNIHTRVLEEAEKKFSSLPKAAKAMNRHTTFFYNEANISSVKAVVNFCKIANVSVEYILTGENYGEYKEIPITYKGFLRLYAKHKGKSEVASICVLAYKIKHGLSKNITLLSLLKVADYFKVSVMDLIGD